MWLATSACTGSHASAGTVQTQTAQISQQLVFPSAAAPQSSSTTAPGELGAEEAALLREAESGNAAAMYRLGRRYATGSGAPKDYQRALTWYRKAAAAGNSDAMYRLGEAYEHGAGVREDIQQAVNWYDQATLRGNKSAKAALERLGESFDR